MPCRRQKLRQSVTRPIELSDWCDVEVNDFSLDMFQDDEYTIGLKGGDLHWGRQCALIPGPLFMQNTPGIRISSVGHVFRTCMKAFPILAEMTVAQRI